MRTALTFLLLLGGCTPKSNAPGTTPNTGPGVEDCADGADNDGNGQIDCDDPACDTTCDADADGSIGVAFGGDDCDDADDSVHPEAPEHCDELDNDCDGLVDTDDPDVDVSTSPWYPDRDSDGYGDGGSVVYQCDPPTGGPAAQVDGDCADQDPARHPGATEVCNGVDDNCDGLTDDADPLVSLTGAPAWYEDADGDGYGDPLSSQVACSRPAGYTDNPDDCDDSDPNIRLPRNWWLDNDGDDHGIGVPVTSCAAPGPDYGDAGGSDCDDSNPAIHPGAYDVCDDAVDSNCDGQDCTVCTEIRVGLLPAWGGGQTDPSLEWTDMLANQASLGSCPITVIDVPGGFTQASLDALDLTVLWSGDAAGTSLYYTPAEMTAITDWVNAGSGGLVTTYLWVYTGGSNADLAALVGVDPNVLLATTAPALANADVLDPAHPLATNLPGAFPLASYLYLQATTAPIASSLLPGATVVMASVDDTNLAIAYEPGPYRGVAFTTFVEYQATSPGDTWQVMYNAAYWASGY